MAFNSPIRAFAVSLACLSLVSCAAVDQFGSRVDDANSNSQDAANRETLLNIVRASKYQPLNFIAVTSVTGGQTESLSTGLPTVSLGPAQTAANHIYQVSNSVSSSVTGGYQSNPLISTQFTSGMLAPISLTTIAYLTAAHPREPVLFVTTEAIVIRPLAGGVFRFRNSPKPEEKIADCVQRILQSKARLTLRDECNYVLFVNFLDVLTQRGFTADIIPGAAPANEKSTAASAKGRYCFDSTRRTKGVPVQNPICGNYDHKGTADKQLPIVLDIPFVGPSTVEIIRRSPFGAYRAIGDLLRQNAPWEFYQSDEATNLVAPDKEPFVNVVSSSPDGCFAWVLYENQNFCVPRSSRHTALLFNILQQLKNLSTSPSDLNSAFSVRLVPN